ncbi:MAG: PAS domain-containing sensor histidine kinase [Armatimonadota bacterium]
MKPQVHVTDDKMRELLNRLAEAEETLRAIRNGEIDGLVVNGSNGDRVFTLEGADRPYRVMVEEMEEGAATISTHGVILYCNRRFAEMLHASHEQVLGATIANFLKADNQTLFTHLVEECWCGRCAHGEVELLAQDGTSVPVSVACGALPPEYGVESICLVVIDLTARKAAEEEILQLNQELETRVEKRTAELEAVLAEQRTAEALIRQQREELRGLAVQLSRAQETERSRIARELHDRIGQQLTVLSLNLNMTISQLSDNVPPMVKTLLDKSLELVEMTGESVRDVMANLRPPALDDYGLVAALRWHGDELSRPTGLAIEVRATDADFRLSPEKEIALFRIVQEALINVVRHARATRIDITVSAVQDTIRIEVTDDGAGFDPHSSVRLRETPGWGLLSMRERAEAIGARLEVTSAPGAGTTVRVEVGR